MIDLKAFSFFSTLPTREIEKLKKESRFQNFASGTIVLKENEELRELLQRKLDAITSACHPYNLQFDARLDERDDSDTVATTNVSPRSATCPNCRNASAP